MRCKRCRFLKVGAVSIAITRESVAMGGATRLNAVASAGALYKWSAREKAKG